MKATSYQIDALTELINIGVGRAAGMLNQILEAHVHLQVPSLKIFPQSQIEQVLHNVVTSPLSIVSLVFKGSFSGTALLAFPPESASNLVSIVAGEDSEISDLDSIRVEALSEIGNIVLNGVMGSVSNVLKKRLVYSIPVYVEDTIEHLLREDRMEDDSTIILAKTELTIKKLRIKGDFILLFRVDLFNALIEILDTM
jgi:chemotaxis protein CheC